MPENTNPKPIEDEDIEVVAHGEDEEAEAGCIVNNSSDIS
ncbi:hypothetical protein SVEN_0536 [Streptomyces venezuelae ATCC 10712]|uniref:Uncharacterized protein n=1 Tax=Streptomyces venezuelae (strain ATCC 10712 / CBS 650.69 / DSM 40230 / JCM 4526 / NBRC 13096 / PD 04745) TaxID=953739 RepID=F2R7D1_STRVP|nr:hypothetical protein SVEN_0536 [Streptomyces venezuelae ATCC 10712]